MRSRMWMTVVRHYHIRAQYVYHLVSYVLLIFVSLRIWIRRTLTGIHITQTMNIVFGVARCFPVCLLACFVDTLLCWVSSYYEYQWGFILWWCYLWFPGVFGSLGFLILVSTMCRHCLHWQPISFFTDMSVDPSKSVSGMLDRKKRWLFK